MKHFCKVVIFISLFAIFFSCRHKEEYIEAGELVFSSDLVFFDTIFASLGSTYQMPTMHNNHNKTLLISSIRLCGGKDSQFRINIDGDTSYYLRDIEIPAKDFKYIFINVTIDPTNQNSPFLVEDSIEFNIDGKKQYLKLAAFGQNAYYHLPEEEITLPDGSIVGGFYASNKQWNNDKPHVIYGACLVEDFDLIIKEGTKIHLNTNAQIVAGRNGRILIEGEKDSVVMFTGIRKDGHYSQLAGQWNRIWLSEGSGPHKISWTVIQNGTTGLFIDSSSVQNISLEIENTIIRNMSDKGIYANNTEIEGENLLVAYCMNSLVSLNSGGKYQFIHCTFANYWGSNYWDNGDFRRASSISITDTKGTNSNFSSEFLNCIIYGNLSNELSIIFQPSTLLKFQNCFIKTAETSSEFYHDCLFNQAPHFVDTKTNNLRPTAISPFIGKGDNSTAALSPTDLDGNPRRNPPAIGAYEYGE